MPEVELDVIINAEELQSIMDEFCQLTNMVTAVLDLKGKVLEATGWQDICVKFHRINPEASLNCTESDLFLAKNLKPGEFSSYKCKNGLWDVVTPLYIENKHLGNIYTGQFFYDDDHIDEKFFIKQAEAYGFDKDSYLDALRRVPRYNRETISHIMNFLVKFTTYISKIGLFNIRLEKEIRERKVAEKELQQKTALLEAQLDSSIDGIIVVDTQGKKVLQNKRTVELWKIPQNIAENDDGEMQVQHVMHMTKNPEQFVGKIAHLNNNPYETSQDEIELKDGTVLDRHSAPVVGKDGQNFGRIWAFRDITERKQAEEALRINTEDLRESQRIAHVGSWRLDTSTNQVVWSEELYKMYGFDPELPPPPYTKHQKLFTAESWERLSAAMLETRDSGTPYELELETVRGDGSRGWMWVRGETILDADGVTVGLRGAAQDITERKQAEIEKKILLEQLNRTHKMESIGVLAGGVAHEINNPINGIMNYAQLILDKIGDDPVGEFAGEIIYETERVAKIVRNLLTFAREEKKSHSPTSINDIVNDTISLIKTVFKRDQISLKVDVPEDLPKIKCRCQQLQQVLMDLITNARDALKEKYSGYDENKIIEITSNLLEKDGKRWIRTTVEDRGIGIDPNIYETLFDPFLTTKGRSVGTGLGLSISHSIVKDHHGELSFESEPGQYTRFHMDLPVDNGWDHENSDGD